MYIHAHADSESGTTDAGGLSTDWMVALGVGIVTVAALIVSCCTKKHHNHQLQGEQIMCLSGIAW